jgi:hypothetical protein
MAAIHRLLCTHCTFGSSELEPSTAENATKVLGYSVRRSSLPEPDRGPLRAAFRAVERLLSYDLPKDTPPEKKETLDAGTAPRRLIFMPNLSGWQAAGLVAYRTRDTHGRIGSYFADVLAARLERDSHPWCPLEVLKLWAAAHDGSLQAAWLCDSEEALAERDGDGRWKPPDEDGPTAPRGSADPFVDDGLLHQFLTLEPGGTTHDPGAIVPPRWWAIPARQRRDLLAALLNATIHSRKNGGKESLVLAAEPSVAALLFYGVFRLLPPRLRAGIGFSTYEAFPERPLTPLVATTFLDGEASAADLPQELAGRGFVCNTFRDVGNFGRRPQPIPSNGFVSRVIELATEPEGWPRLDNFLATIDELPRPDFRTLDELARIEVFVTDYVTGSQKSDKLGPEPSASPGSDGERYRRIRFRSLIEEASGSHVGKWPRDIVRKAIAWLGEEFAAGWDGGGPVADALRSRLPDDDNGLAKVFETLSTVRAVPPHFVSEAVVRVALAADSPGLPPSFAKFIGGHPGKDKGRDTAPRADATAIVQAVTDRLAAENRQDVLEASDPEFVEPILFAIAAWEKICPRRWQDLHLPLLPLVERALRVTNTTAKERIEFLVRHHELAGVVKQGPVPPELVATLRECFDRTLQFSTSPAKRLMPGELLSGQGRSLAKVLPGWVDLVTPESERRRYADRLNAWITVHETIGRLREPAATAGMFTKCSSDLLKFAQAYELLTLDNPTAGSSASQKMSLFLAKSLDGLNVAESARKTLVRWLVASIPDDLDGGVLRAAPGTVPTTASASRGGRDRPGRKKNWVVPCIVVAMLALVCGGVMFWQRYHSSPAESATGDDTRVGTGGSGEETSSQDLPTTSAGATATSISGTQRSPAARATPPLTHESLSFAAKLEAGKLKVTWNKDAVVSAKTKTLTLKITPPNPGSATEKPISDVNSGTETWEPQRDAFGAYTAQLIAEGAAAPKFESSKITIDIARPPAPKVENIAIDVASDGKPRLRFRFASPSDLNPTRYGTCKLVLSMPDNAPQQQTDLNESLTFELPPGLVPSRVLDGKSQFQLHVQTDVGSGDACAFQVPKPSNLEAELCARLQRSGTLGVPHVCPLSEKFSLGDVTDLLELPWWLLDDDIKSLDLDLLEPTPKTDDRLAALTPTTEAKSEWSCKVDEVPVGSFEIHRPPTSPWKPVLRFVTSQEQKEGNGTAYELLRTFKLCFTRSGKPVCTAQLRNPLTMGSLVLHIPSEPNKDKLPAIAAKVGLPPAWDRIPGKVLSGSKADESQPRGVIVAFQSPAAQSTLVAHLVAARGQSEISANVNLRLNGLLTLLQINTWTWANVPKIEPRQRDDAPAAIKKPVLPQLLKQIGDRLKQLRELDEQIAQLRAAHAKASAKDKPGKMKEITDSNNLRTDVDKTRTDKADAHYMPCFELFEALTDKDIEIDAWQLSWKVNPKTASGIEVPADVPGGIVVVGAVGRSDAKPPIRLEFK